LDGSRVHPETYEWARKMAVDALELDDAVDQTVALEEILKAPERLKELDLDAFAEELTRQVCNRAAAGKPLALRRTETLNGYNFPKWRVGLKKPKIGNRKSTLLYRLV
jgi:hypothetical protein